MTPTAMVRYSAGPWLGLVRGRSLVTLPADASEETAAVLWDLLAGTPGVEHLLATVLSGRLDLTGMPAFAIVSFAGQDVHAILRGDVHLRTTGLDDVETRLSGTGVSTWAERIVPGVRSFELLVDDALPDTEDLPLEAGAVRLAALQADLVAAPVPPAEPAEEGADHAAPVVDEQPDGESDIDMTIAPDAAGFLSSPSVPHAQEPSGLTTLVQPAEDGTASRGEADVVAPSEADPQELIDAVPWLAAARRAVPVPEQPRTGHPDGGSRVTGIPAAPGQTVAPEAHPDDDVDADTVLSPSAAAQAAAGPAAADRVSAPPSGSPAEPPPAVPADPDHDGETVMRSDLDLAGVETAVPAAPAPPATGPMVLARQCSNGHANPPTSSTCTLCGQSLGGEARQVRRPALGRVRMSTGEVLELDRPAVIGRQPQADRVGSGTMPRMIQVRSPNGDISRSHCEVVLEGWHVQLRDLKATNGTVLIREGAAPRRLGQGETVMVLDGDIADLGDGVSLRFEAIP
ncbi:MAG: hypothetical protein MOP51_2248 [Citricoccus sp.]|nr:hypothetical protein [Citricoccus sp. WCRC_4]